MEPYLAAGLPLSWPPGDHRTSVPSAFRSYLKNDVLSVQHNIVNHVEYTIGRTRYRCVTRKSPEVTELRSCVSPA